MVLRGKACPVSKDALPVFCSLLECFFAIQNDAKTGRAFWDAGQVFVLHPGEDGQIIKN